MGAGKMAPEDSFREKTERQRAVRIRISAVNSQNGESGKGHIETGEKISWVCSLGFLPFYGLNYTDSTENERKLLRKSKF
ncbi:MAG: hypothetical protein ACLUD2_09870 [Clostridium sp.]